MFLQHIMNVLVGVTLLIFLYALYKLLETGSPEEPEDRSLY